ncbi:hypothetical protein ACJX0J_027613, partial [Zea mays]
VVKISWAENELNRAQLGSPTQQYRKGDLRDTTGKSTLFAICPLIRKSVPRGWSIVVGNAILKHFDDLVVFSFLEIDGYIMLLHASMKSRHLLLVVFVIIGTLTASGSWENCHGHVYDHFYLLNHVLGGLTHIYYTTCTTSCYPLSYVHHVLNIKHAF